MRIVYSHIGILETSVRFSFFFPFFRIFIRTEGRNNVTEDHKRETIRIETVRFRVLR